MFYREALKQLEKWSKKENRKPMIIRGARQVGKTTLIKMFSKSFDYFIHLDLEDFNDNRIFEINNDIEGVIKGISLLKNKPVISGKTLLFIDEIQNSIAAIKMLKFFAEKYGNLHVVAAGSLLEVVLTAEDLSFPVGRVEFLFLHPVSFKEFLLAKGGIRHLEALNTYPLPSYSHGTLLNEFHEYAMLGGLPEVVKTWIEKGDLLSAKEIMKNLMISYMDDVTKYAKNSSMRNVIRFVIDAAPMNISSRITFQNFGNSNYRSREVGEAFFALQQAMLINLIYPTTSTEIPFLPNKRKKPKLQFIDTGLVNYKAGIIDQYIGLQDLQSVYKGRIVEHLVGQELTNILETNQKLKFWVREKKQSQAEVDFIISYKGKPIPIEVKSGSSGKLRSLHQFIKESKTDLAVRFCSSEYKEEIVETNNVKFTLLNLPYYSVCEIYNILENYLKNKNLF